MAPTTQLAGPLTSTDPVLHCCATWHALAAAGTVLPNRPVQEATWDAIRTMPSALLRPLYERFGVVVLSYGFAGPELSKVVKKRAAAGGWLPNISPANDQHAGYELNSRGKRICEHDGIAVDLRVPGVSSEVVAQWVIDNLPFDAIYLYNADRPFHLSWAREPRGTVVRMFPFRNGRLIPKVIVKGRMNAGPAQ
ncbi:MAG TPA: hypothetical protein VK550_28260 [Polyangiaceae bacterium]|nr:hypothetical protein [Polyangiaceae bacterium]